MNAIPSPRSNRLRNKTAEVFGVDLRSLAAFRVGVAGVLLLDLWYRGQEVAAYFSDGGVLPRVARIDLSGFGGDFGFEHQWSLHMLSGETWAQVALLLLAAWFAVWLMIGYRTRLAAVASWILLMSLDGRNPVILNSGDVILRSMMLWSLFLPLGARFSVDAWKSPDTTPPPTRFLSVASAALLLQLCIMYFFSVIFKMKPVENMASPWTGDFSAVYYALNCDAYVTDIGIWIRQFPNVMKFLTVSSLGLEIVGPLLVFSPWLTKWFRAVVVVSFISFHVGLGLCMTIGLFPVICIICWLVFVPGEFWSWINTRSLSKRWKLRAKLLRDRLPLKLFARHESPSLQRHWYIQLLTTCMLVYLLLWNIRETDFTYWESRLLPRTWNGPARVLGLDQNWSMFAPLPRTEDGWLVMEGTLHDGSIVNLWEFDRPLPWSKPASVSATYHTQRWRKYLDNLTTSENAAHRVYFCDWLARRWNKEQAQGDDSREVHKVELSHQIELTPPPGNLIPAPEARVLWTWYYE